MLAAVLLYGYATGTYSSRKIEQACYDSVAFRYIAANTHPDHYTLCAFRWRFLPELQGLFVQVLQIARQMKRLKLGTIAPDGTKVHANASTAQRTFLRTGHTVGRAAEEGSRAAAQTSRADR
jgi:transposase